MRTITLLVVTILAASASFIHAQDEKGNPDGISVSAQGWIRQASGPWFQVSPQGRFEMEIIPARNSFSCLFPCLESDLRITSSEGGSWILRGVPGSGFFLSDAGRIAVIKTIGCHATNAPSTVLVLDFAGKALVEREVHLLTDPKLSTDGTRLIYRSRKGVVALNLETLEETSYPCFDLFAAGPGGSMAGVHFNDTMRDDPVLDNINRIILYDDGIQVGSIPFPGQLRKIDFAQDGKRLFLLTPTALVALSFPSGAPQRLYTPPKGAELRDLHVSSKGLHLGMRRIQGNQVSGALVKLDAKGGRAQFFDGPLKKMGPEPSDLARYDTIPWPFKPNGQHPVGCTHGQFLHYNGWPDYLHPGIDVLGPPGQAVHAVKGGVVKALHTTGGSLYWRIAIGDKDTSGTCKGYLYVHLVQSSIAVNLGDPVQKGQYLGDMIGLSHYDLTHLHLARIQDTGVLWPGNWLVTENCHLDLQKQDENEAPVFENALGSDLFAFCTNQTSNYLNPQTLKGEVDIIVRVSDKIQFDRLCTVQEIRYTIYPKGAPQSPVVDDKLAVFFDMELDIYQGGTFAAFLMELLYKRDGVCQTQCNLVSQEYYHIITNSDGNQVYQPSDLMEAWDTTLVPDGDYVVEVTARDVAGNETTESMEVTTDN